MRTNEAGPISEIDADSTISQEIFQAAGPSISIVTHRAWPESYLLGNGIVEAIVVPAIGRVMQFRRCGDVPGTFWENPALEGQLHHRDGGGWLNFGGDKCWPAPQTAWRQQGRAWPPPAAFDAAEMDAVASDGKLTLTSPVDSAWGMQVVRHIELDRDAPVMRIRNEYRKVDGAPVRAAIWTITQMQEPERVFMRMSPDSKFANGYVRLLDAEPADLRVEGGLLSMVRHPRASTKIGVDGTSMAWVGASSVVRIDVEPASGEYPDGGCITEVYTNPDPMRYVELETLGPLTLMNSGDSIEQVATYSALPRTTADADVEAARAFSRI